MPEPGGPSLGEVEQLLVEVRESGKLVGVGFTGLAPDPANVREARAPRSGARLLGASPQPPGGSPEEPPFAERGRLGRGPCYFRRRLHCPELDEMLGRPLSEGSASPPRGAPKDARTRAVSPPACTFGNGRPRGGGPFRSGVTGIAGRLADPRAARVSPWRSVEGPRAGSFSATSATRVTARLSPMRPRDRTADMRTLGEGSPRTSMSAGTESRAADPSQLDGG